MRAAATLPNGYLYEYPGVGHRASAPRGCPQQMFMAFLDDPWTEPNDACIATMR